MDYKLVFFSLQVCWLNLLRLSLWTQLSQVSVLVWQLHYYNRKLLSLLTEPRTYPSFPCRW